jgi:polygalacturonase
VKSLHTTLFPLAAIGLFVAFPSLASATVEIAPTPEASHVARIEDDTVFVASGSTFSFTVDSPEDQGPVSTAPSVDELLAQIAAKEDVPQRRQIVDRSGAEKNAGKIENGDRLIVTSHDGQAHKIYALQLTPLALSGRLSLKHDTVTVNTVRDLTLSFTAGQRSPDAIVKIFLPAGIYASLENTTVNVIGRGAVTLKDLPRQSIGRVGSAYSYSKVGEVSIDKSPDGGSVLAFKHLDLRPANGPDLVIVIQGVKLEKPGTYSFRATYTTAQPEILTSAGTGSETATLHVIKTISDFARSIDRSLQYKETPTTYTTVNFTWTSPAIPAAAVQLMHSLDEGKTWAPLRAVIDSKNSTASVSDLAPDRLHTFRLVVSAGENQGASNSVQVYSGKRDIKTFGVSGDGTQDDTPKINAAIAHLASIGGGTLLFSDGVYSVRTVHLQSNVYLYVDKGATINALKGGDAPEPTWFSDKKYRSGLSPTDRGPYENPENWLTKQDVGHTFFRNAMFFGERLDNVKIVGNGRISGNGNLVTGDRVMNNPPDNRSDKMFALKLCTNVEIGGLHRDEDLWYDPEKDEPYYIGKDGAKISDVGNMLTIDRGGHFVLLATGTDGINVHNTYFAKHSTSHARDIYDFMQCNDVTVTNIYSKVSSDDIVKTGSDCSLGFTRPVKKYRVRNIVGDTNCNLFQIGSETVDDIMDLCVDNIYVLGANKAGFSISTNDGGHIKDVHLNCGHTGTIHSRSKMLRTHTPFFISISNRGRALGATVERFKFAENGNAHDELLNTNIDIGVVENILLNGVDVTEIYAGSSFRGERWKAYDGSQRKAAPIVAGYKLPDTSAIEGGLPFTLPNGRHTGYVKNVVFNDVHFLAKGGNPRADTDRLPPELGVGQYNASNLGVLPAYGLWARHVEGLTITNCTFNYEKRDSTFALYLENVIRGKISAVKMVRASDADALIRIRNARDITIEKATAYDDQWSQSPRELAPVNHAAGDRLID